MMAASCSSRDVSSLVNSVVTLNIGNSHTSACLWQIDGTASASMNSTEGLAGGPIQLLHQSTGDVQAAPFIDSLVAKVVTHLTSNALDDISLVISGSVPRVEANLLASLKGRWNLGPVYIFGVGLREEGFTSLECPLEIVPEPKKSVGRDRLCGALGALSRDQDCVWIVIDSGTAITVNVVTPCQRSLDGRWIVGRFEGGLIMPGERLMLQCLTQGTAQLPLINLWPLPTSDVDEGKRDGYQSPPLIGLSVFP